MSQTIYTANMGMSQLCAALTLSEKRPHLLTKENSKLEAIIKVTSASRLQYKHVSKLDKSICQRLQISQINCDDESLYKNGYVQINLNMTDEKGHQHEYFILYGCPEQKCVAVVFHRSRPIEGHLRKDLYLITAWCESFSTNQGSQLVEYLKTTGHCN